MGRKGHSHRNQKRRRQQSSKNQYQSKSARAAQENAVNEELPNLHQQGGTRARAARQEQQTRQTPSKQGPRPAKVKKGRVRAEQIKEISQEIFGGTYYCVGIGRSNGSEIHQNRS